MELDELHYAILDQLQIDGRLSNAEIGRRIGLTAPAVAERIKRMQAEGVIRGITAKYRFQATELFSTGVGSRETTTWIHRSIFKRSS